MNRKSDLDKSTAYLKYNTFFNVEQMLSFMRVRAIEGMEMVTDKSYARTFRLDGSSGYFIVKNKPDQFALELKVACTDKSCHTKIRNRVRRMFDLDTDFTRINQNFLKDEHLSKGMKKGQVPGLSLAFQPFELAVRAILGQQISIKAATTLAARIVKKAKLETSTQFPPGLNYFFPGPSDLLALDLDGLGITKTRQVTIKTMIRGLLDKRFNLIENQDFDTFRKEFSALKGIGDWTVNYVAMRGLGMSDSFPSTDLGVIKSLSKDGNKPTQKQIKNRAENWRPYRAYAVLCLWNQ